MNCQKELIQNKLKLAELANQKSSCKNWIHFYGKELVKELQKIPGWECMILSCEMHMKEFKTPNEFFDICSYEFDEYEDANILYVKKYYSGADPDGYNVLALNLEVPLEQQVKNMKGAIKKKHDKDLQAKYITDMETLRRLKVPILKYEEWLKKIDEYDNWMKQNGYIQ